MASHRLTYRECWLSMAKLNFDSGLKDNENYVHYYASTMRTLLFEVLCEEMSSQPASSLSSDPSSLTLSYRKLLAFYMDFPCSFDHQLLVQLDKGSAGGRVEGQEAGRSQGISHPSSLFPVWPLVVALYPKNSRSSQLPLQQEVDPLWLWLQPGTLVSVPWSHHQLSVSLRPMNNNGFLVWPNL